MAGRNRLQAAEELGWETIKAIELPDLDEEDDAKSVGQLAEIAENLHRREITAFERNSLYARWVEIIEARGDRHKPAEVRQVSATGGRGRTGGLAQAARNLNVPRSTLQQAVKIAQLSPEAQAEMRKLNLDNNQSALLEAAKAKTPEAQVATLRQRAKATKSKAAPVQQEDATTLARLAEVAENLHRREITALERDELVVRWAELVEQRAGQVAQPVPAVLSDGRKAGPQHKAKADGIRQTARELGMSRESVRRAMKVGNLSQEAKQAAREHGLANNRGALLEAAKEDTPEAQVATLQQRAEAVKPKAAPAPKAQAKVEPQPDGGKGLANLLAAWKAATEAERQQFLNEIGRA